MIIVLKQNAPEVQVREFCHELQDMGLQINDSKGSESHILGLIGDTKAVAESWVLANPVVETCRRVTEPYKKANRKFHPDDSVIDVDGVCSSLLALVENLQRRDLDFLEEAMALDRLIHTYDLSQDEAARRLGKSQSAVANKLRLLRLPEDVRALLRENGLTERHARALLRLQDPEVQRRAAGDMVRRGMNVAQAEAYVEKLLQSDQVTPPRGRSTYIIKDVRLFLNSVDRGLHLMRQAGVDAGWNRQDTDREILLTIRIPKRASGKIDSVSESC
mgnify:CR=1 FL=1